MKQFLRLGAFAVVMASASCATTRDQDAWLVEKIEIALYHSSTTDPTSGRIAHVEYCASRLSRGRDVLHIVYRPIDFPNRNPGFAKGDKVTIKGLDKAKDFGAMEGKDVWIYDVKIEK